MKNINRLLFLSSLLTLTFLSEWAYAQLSENQDSQLYQLDNPISVQYLKRNLRKSQPRLVLNQDIEKRLREKLQTDPFIQHIFQAIKHNTESVLAMDLITVEVPDNPRSQKNQLGISRNFLYRVNMLGMVYFVEKDPEILQRINDEVVAACNFPTWNPKHFLDVGEMSLAIALVLDWTAGKLPTSTISLAKKSLIEKGIMPSWPKNGETPRWVNGTNNWNQVCNAGMIAASIAIAEENPALAAKTMKRSIEGMNHALAEYAPDGAYPEGATYWGYGTMFSVVTAAMLESAFGTDFGIGEYPGFKESANFAVLTLAPSKLLYNYADSPDIPELYIDFTLSWFAAKTGDKNYLNHERFMQTPEEIGKLSRLAGAGLVWTAQFEEKGSGFIPNAWKGEGANPLVIFTGQGENKEGYYFGGKGGRGSISHGNMDAGSFIFELNGVRWVIDPGNQSYGLLSRAGFDLWSRCQECDRWKLLTKNNFGHSTISVDNKRHVVDGLATIVYFKGGEKPEATFDLTPTFEGQLKSARRKFTKDSQRSIIIEDQIETNDATKLITWQLMTQANIKLVDGGAVLTQEGKTLRLENLSHPEISLSVISLDPAPLELDRQIENLKRIELRIPAWILAGNKGEIKVRLSGE
ncbi:heparinase II/III family protein [Cyclobacterium sp. 1_MG-2023]|uniref:heparinase II/III domain-containing protein n=1 Tax=Cyclobacterium sp. 1_MG-2023 TaxID=3062681 RepID=UPI0026E3C669|nr:heparinase II/III family protein [Cyclobacterium sp. 1_MG-2023]MDO6439007.1 heparinase II/III family protein [Cyclobacterium sp. 1_MG-2023]